MKTVLVVAGNMKEFEYFKRETRDKYDRFIYVSGTRSIRGTRGAEIKFYGTFYTRLDFSAIEREVDYILKAGDLV